MTKPVGIHVRAQPAWVHGKRAQGCMVRLVVQQEMSEEQRPLGSVQPAWLRCLERVKFLIRCVLWSP